MSESKNTQQVQRDVLPIPVAADGKKTFTILHTNDLHSNLIGMGPASDYTPDQHSTTTRPGAGSRVWPP